MLQINNTNLLDTDKQLTFDTARLEFSRSSAILVVDIDELLAGENNIALRSTVDMYFNSPKYQEKENWWIKRMALGGLSPSGVVEYNENSDKAVIDRIEDCFLKGAYVVWLIVCSP